MVTSTKAFSQNQALVLSAWLQQCGKKHFQNLPKSQRFLDFDILDDMEINCDLCRHISAESVAVARILLRDDTRHLPHWGVFDGDGTVIEGRDESWKERLKGPVGIINRTLFEINWATTGPIYSWPERYTACPVPGEDISVIVASVDCSDVFGYTDFALDWVEDSDDLVEKAGEVIRDWWMTPIAAWNQPRWESFTEGGLVDRETALVWREAVWEALD